MYSDIKLLELSNYSCDTAYEAFFYNLNYSQNSAQI